MRLGPIEIFTGLLVVVAALQYLSLEKTLATQRAYVALAPILLPTEIGSAKAMHIQTNWINNGNIQTTVTIIGRCTSVKNGIFDFSNVDPDFSKAYPPRHWVFGPKSTISYINCHVRVDLIKALRDNQLPVYIFCQAKYLDGITEKQRITQFCMEVTPLGDAATNSLSTQAIACETHNCADKECDIYKPFP